MKPVTLKQPSATLSVATVSRALSDWFAIPHPTQDRVFRLAAH